jgi:hypothetical protein
MAKKRQIDPVIRKRLGVPRNVSDSDFLREWKTTSRRVCKPCWELKYCPYGPLVEQSPLLPPLRSEAIKHNEYLKECLKTGKLGDGEPLDARRRASFKQSVKKFKPANYPLAIPAAIDEMSCRVFGHICPVVFNAEGFSETKEPRRIGRYIPNPVKMRVARRDNYMCQETGCGKMLRDFDIEFDHIIPVSRGGSSVEHNIRVTCFDHNRDKGRRVQI